MVRYFEENLQVIHSEVLKMWSLVQCQMEKSGKAFLENDIHLALKVIEKEKKVDAYEVIIERYCEQYIALNTPVAIDLRFILSILKINTALERIGDFAKGIAKFVIDDKIKSYNQELIKDLEIEKMFTEALKMFHVVKEAFEKGDTKLASSVFVDDNILDEINRNSVNVIAEYIHQDSGLAYQSMVILSVIRKLERFGDHCTNIAENIIFYYDALVIKHQGSIEADNKIT